MFSKKRKVDAECRVFQERWKEKYFFWEVRGKPVCLICSQQVAVAKEFNIKRHYETHAEKYGEYTGQLRTQKLNELASSLQKQQAVFSKCRETHEGAVKASYIIAGEIAAASKPLSEGEFVKTCMLKAAELVCPEKRQALANISLSRNTVAERVGELSADLNSQLKDKIKSFIAFSIALDESTDVTDVTLAQLAVFIRGVDASLNVTEEFVSLVPMTDTTTAEDVLASLVGALDRLEVDWSRAVNLVSNPSSTLTECSSRAQLTLPDPQLVSGALIDVAKHLGNLAFRVWEKMKEVVKFTPVILDPNTASPWLSLSDDLTSGRRHGRRQQLPDNPERFTRYTIVLGSEGFSSGKHSWEVEVGDHPLWAIGVARESADRKGEQYVSPKCGFWYILQRSGEYTNVLGETLPLKRRLQRIRVQLDCDRGKVSFYDPEDTTHIYTHKYTFTEKLYPYFSIGASGVAIHPDVVSLH